MWKSLKLRSTPLSVTRAVIYLWLCWLPVTGSTPALAETPGSIPNPLKTNRSWVADSANVLSANEEKKLNDLLSPLERENSAEVAIVTVQTLGGQTVEEFAHELFELWGIGKKGKDNGILVLAAIADRKMRIEVGYGLEDKVTDADASAILRDDLRPAFKSGAYGQGLIKATGSLIQLISPGFTPSTGPGQLPSGGGGLRPERPGRWGAPTAPALKPGQVFPALLVGALCFLIPVVGIVLLAVGGIYLMTRPRKCPHCGTAMEKLSETEDDQYLTPPQQFEEQIGSVDYHVWRCPACHRQEMDHRKQFFSQYTECPRCHNRTLFITNEVLESPTYFQEGRLLITSQCQWQGCRFRDEDERRIPRRQRTDHHSSLGTGIAIGGILGGGSSGHSSDSGGWSGGGSAHDSGPSDFGGGSSGGGGASDSW